MALASLCSWSGASSSPAAWQGSRAEACLFCLLLYTRAFSRAPGQADLIRVPPS